MHVGQGGCQINLDNIDVDHFSPHDVHPFPNEDLFAPANVTNLQQFDCEILRKKRIVRKNRAGSA